LFCSLIPIILDVFKFLYPIAPFCSIGIMMTAVIVYIFNISSEYEHLIMLENRITKMASRQNLETVKAIAQLFKKMTVIDLKVGRCRILKDDTRTDKADNVDKKAQDYLSDMVGVCVTQDHLEGMREFINLETLGTRLAGKTTISHEYIDKKDAWCRAYFIKINEDESHLPDEVIFAIEDIDDEKLAELEHNMHVEGENAIYREMLLAQGDGMIVTDMDNNIVIMNDAAGRMFGIREVENTGFGLQDLIEKCESEDKSKILDMLFALKTIGGRRSYEFTINNEDSKISVMATTYVTVLKANNMRVVITSLADISAKKSLEKALTAMSETDALTGISNRGGGEAKIMKLLEEGTPGLFALMDVDKFKSVNDTFGHGVGDKVLIEVAKCLVRSFRDQDVVMRLGGDEFAVYAKGVVKPETAKVCLDRLYKEVSEIVVEELAQNGYSVTISLGAVFCTKHQVQTFDELYQKADNVMYVSKRSGGNHYEIA
ncbi:MAG: sensor domain-containing diguanylate cyclase, partial [Lachnospiraceae bacterium]|nr:sensor domain-containing diguanylate cyclase [Lachnospiraceae bacterium]